MKRTISILLTGSILCVITLFLLVRFSDKPNEHKNGFNRHWLAKKSNLLYQAAITSPLEYIAGVTRSHYFFTVPNPQWLVMTDSSLHRQDTIRFPVPLTQKLLSLHTFFVDSPWVYLHANNYPALYYARIGEGTLQGTRLVTSLFTKSAQVSPACLVVRSFDSTRQQQLFQKIDSRTGGVTRQAVIIPQEKEDGGFSTDGLLQYDSLTKRLVFVQFYQNRFFSVDTNLNLLYTGKTIDTMNTNPVSIQKVRIDHEDRLMPATPRAKVNEQSCVSNGRLFILSGLIADNEEQDAFHNNAVIDCYRISNGQYIGSFYIPNLPDEKVRSFLVVEDRLVALYKGYIAAFSIGQLL